MAIKMTNNAASTLAGNVSSGATSFTVVSGSTFPSLSSGDHTYVTIGTEVIKVTAISSANFTCIATGAAHSAGDTVELRVTAELLNDFSTDEESLPKSGGAMTGAITTNSTFDGRDVAADGVLATNALPKSGGAMTGAITTNSTFDGRDVAADGVLATNAMPKSGGAFTGAVTTNSTIDGRDVAADGVTADAALPKAGGTMTGNLSFGDNNQIRMGGSNDLAIYHENTNHNSFIHETGSGSLYIRATDLILKSGADNDDMAKFIENGAVELYHSNAKKIETTSAGATVTGALAVTGTVDGVDIQTLNTTANAALPKAGGAMTGHITGGDNIYLKLGDGNDLQLHHDGSHSYIVDDGTGDLIFRGSANVKMQGPTGEAMLTATADGSVELYENNVKKLETTANGVTVTGGAVGTMTTDNDGSFAMSASNNFKCTPAGNFALTFTSIVAQSGNILFINSGGHTISAHANTKVDATLLATISTAGTYLLSYFSDGTNVYMTNSAAYA